MQHKIRQNLKGNSKNNKRSKMKTESKQKKTILYKK